MEKHKTTAYKPMLVRFGVQSGKGAFLGPSWTWVERQEALPVRRQGCPGAPVKRQGRLRGASGRPCQATGAPLLSDRGPSQVGK